MKNVTFSGNALTRLLKSSVLAIFFVSFLTASAQAADTKPNEIPVEVKYLGSVAGKPLFQIVVNNPQGEEAALTLRDENGNTIYTDVVKEKNYTRKLQFNELEADKLVVTLTLRTKKSTQSKTFAITRNTRVVEDVAVVNL